MAFNKFGRLVAPKDGRDFKYLARHAMVQLEKPAPRVAPYKDGPLLDQGDTPQCVGFSSRGFLDGAPVMSKATQGPNSTQIYQGAQKYDEWPGDNYDGTSVRGAMKYLQAINQISSYVWAQTLEEAIKWMNGGYGTIVVGTNWYAEMSNVDRNGYMLEPASSMSTPIGGHAWRWNWYDAKRQAILMRNSWGNDFGYKVNGKPSGYAFLKIALAQRLLAEDGEIAAPTQTVIAPTVF